MISIIDYIYEGAVKEHFKKHWKKYALGAGVLTGAALAPEAAAKFQGKLANQKAHEGFLHAKSTEDMVNKLKDSAKHYDKEIHLKQSPYNVFGYFRK